MKESTRRWITQVLVPGILLFGGLAVMYGPAYFSHFQKKWLAYSLLRESMFGPPEYEVKLEADFTAVSGEDYSIVVLAELDEEHSARSNRQEVVLINSWNRVVRRELHENVGAIRSTHLSPQDGFAVLEIVRQNPDDRWQADVARYQVTADRIDPMEMETRSIRPEWGYHGRGRHHRDGDGHHRGRDRDNWDRDDWERWQQWKADRRNGRSDRRRHGDRESADPDEVDRDEVDRDEVDRDEVDRERRQNDVDGRKREDQPPWTAVLPRTASRSAHEKDV